MEFYARTDKSGKPELLEHHSELVAKKTAEYADLLGCRTIGELCGALHDCGKRTKKFQEVLFGSRTKVDHAIVAGILIYNSFPDFPVNTRRIIAGVCAAHHTGLRCDINDYSVPTDFDSREQMEVSNDYGDAPKENALSSKAEYLSVLEYEKTTTDALTASTKGDIFDLGNVTASARMLFARMLLSCLVDADYSSAASVDDPEYFAESELPPLTDLCIERMLKQLESYRNRIIQNTDQTTRMNILRGIVYKDASEAGKRAGCAFCTMTAPTGTAKTLAIMKYALEKAKVEHHKRIFIILPFLSIITQNADEYKRIFGQDIVLEDDSQTEYTDKTREYSDRWSAPIIVTTSVKFFSTLFAAKSTELRRLHQVADSVVVFDECQSLPSSVLDCTIYALQQLAEYYHTDVLFSTATLPSYQYRKNIEWHAEEVIKDVTNLYEKYHVAKNTNVEFAPKDMEYDAESLADRFSGKNQAVFIFNTTKKAREMYRELIGRCGMENCRILTSALCTDHKRDITNWIKKRLKEGKPCLLASTQSIEAGVDVSFPCGAREYAPFSSVAQSAGRINRNGESYGYMLVFRHKDHTSPGSDYASACEKTIYIAEKKRKKGGLLSTDSLEDMNSYYIKLFRSAQDKKALKDAILEENYYETERNYSIIEDKGQINIIVPYRDNEKSLGIYREIASELRESDYGITKGQMKRASGITVSVFPNKIDSVKACCQPLSIMTRGGQEATNWYLLEDEQYYTEHGLDLESVGIGSIY